MQSVNIEEISLEFTSIAPSFFIWKGLCWKQKNMSEQNPPPPPPTKTSGLPLITDRESRGRCRVFEKLFERVCVCVEDRFIFLTCKASHLELARNTQQINKPSHFKRKLSDVDVWFFFHHHCSHLSWKTAFDVSSIIDSPSIRRACLNTAELLPCAMESGRLLKEWRRAILPRLYSFFPLDALTSSLHQVWVSLIPLFLYLQCPLPPHPLVFWFTVRTSAFPPQECGARWKSHAAEPKLHSDLAMLCNSSESQCS